MTLTDRKPSGALRVLLRLPIWLYRARLGRLLGHRLLYLAHRGRRTGVRHEVVAETIRFDRDRPEAVVVAAWGKDPDWYRNLRVGPALEVRIGGRRWIHPAHRFLDGAETLRTLLAYRQAHPRAWQRIAPVLGFPTDPTDPRWPEVADSVHAIAFTPRQDST